MCVCPCVSSDPKEECDLPKDEAGIIWDSICFSFLLLQRRVFMSYYFLHVVADIRAGQILASRYTVLKNISLIITLNVTNTVHSYISAVIIADKSSSRLPHIYILAIVHPLAFGRPSFIFALRNHISFLLKNTYFSYLRKSNVLEKAYSNFSLQGHFISIPQLLLRTVLARLWMSLLSWIYEPERQHWEPSKNLEEFAVSKNE